MDDDALVELTQCCARSCLVLKAAMEGEDVSDLSQPIQRAIEILEKYVDFTWPLLSSITIYARTVRYIQSKVDEHVQGANSPLEHPSESTGMSPVLWNRELRKALEVIEVCDYYFRLLWFLNYLSHIRRMSSLLPKTNRPHSRPTTPRPLS